MIYVLSGRPEATEIVVTALQRSCGRGSITIFDAVQKVGTNCIFVLIDPVSLTSEKVQEVLSFAPSKLIVFGNPGDHLSTFGLSTAPIDDDLRKAGSCAKAEPYTWSQSQAEIRYHRSLADEQIPLKTRAFLRYDFEDEWNNLGFGAVRTDESIWSISCLCEAPETSVVAAVKINDRQKTVWCAICDEPRRSILWFNRPVGPVDSPEWIHVEEYLSSYRSDVLPCQPVIEQIPHGFDAAVTMRLDCDEDVESARGLFEFYRSQGIPFSLALLGKVLDEKGNHALPKDILAASGSVLSHSMTHRVDWGGNYAEALYEAVTSASLLRDLYGREFKNAVSPFHQTPRFARDALEDAGYTACVGGIICNDPDFLMARAGYAPDGRGVLIGHSQQCMLHGDCMLDGDEPLRIYEEAFDIACRSRTFFGYLDHPFSTRYTYGWSSEEIRLHAHERFLGHIKKARNVLFASEDDALDFVTSCANVTYQETPFTFRLLNKTPSKWLIAIRWRGERTVLHQEREFRFV